LLGLAAAGVFGSNNGGRIALLLIVLPFSVALVSSILAQARLGTALALAGGAALVGVGCGFLLLVIAGLSGALA